MFPVVSEASIDAKLSKIQNVKLEKGEEIVGYSKRIMELVNELVSACHSVSDLERKRSLLQVRNREFDATVEAIMDGSHPYHEVFYKLIFKETRLQESEDNSEKEFVTQGGEKTKKCYTSGKVGNFSKDCWQKKEEKRICYVCGKSGHIANFCKSKKKDEDKGGEQATKMLTVPIAMPMNLSRNSCDKWILDSGCKRQMTNRRENFISFTKENGIVKVGNNDVIKSEGYGVVLITKIVQGNRKTIDFNNVLCAPDLMYNLISISKGRRNNFKAIIDSDDEKPGMVYLD